MTAREAAFVSLQKYENNKKFANIEADTAIRRNHLEGADRALYTSIFYGTVERKITLDYYIDFLSKRKADIDANVRIILRMSLYQLAYLDRVPDYAILNDAGELCKRFAAKNAVSFINGLLRNFIRKKDEIRFPDEKLEPISFLSVRYSYPAWLMELWVSSYGYQKTKRILDAFDINPPITLRVNTLKTDIPSLLEAFSADAIGVRETLYANGGLRLTGHTPLDKIPGFDAGLCYVQDEASQIAVSVLDPKPGEILIDACSCPGGKSFTSAMRMENKGRIRSYDLHKNKLKLVSEGAEKLGISMIETAEQNGAEFVPELESSADRVLCDVPCSGLGVLSKKPDIRHKEKDEVDRLPAIQYAILENCARYVKENGILVYSTCTLNPAENEENVKKFLAVHKEFRAEPIVIEKTKTICKEDGMLTVFPDEFDGCDGFFVAKMRKIKAE
ncbi:MAG: 16S rRNA (cytosine(967)-C(5))-methyltransferase RsmB [Clostridia bacterium]|nr:16S rRNA (cytosine(967)-C(5))-methyltransferase RsmB [Clostridia bacterium]